MASYRCAYVFLNPKRLWVLQVGIRAGPALQWAVLPALPAAALCGQGNGVDCGLEEPGGDGVNPGGLRGVCPLHQDPLSWAAHL